MLTKHDLIASPNFHWIGGCTSRNTSDKDISIGYIHWDKKHSEVMSFSFVFRGEKIKEAIGEWVQIAVYKNRIMFRKAKAGSGYHALVKANSPSQNAYFRIKETNETMALKRFIGDYDLKYDDFYELYYIEKEAK